MSTVLPALLRTPLPNTIINPPQQSCYQTFLEQFRAISERSCAPFSSSGAVCEVGLGNGGYSSSKSDVTLPEVTHFTV